MKFKSRLIVANVLLITLALGFATLVFLGQLQQGAREFLRLEQTEALKMLRFLLQAKGDYFSVVEGELRVGDYPLNGTTEVLTPVQETFGGVITIFLGDVRVATTLEGDDGELRVGSRLEGAARRAVVERHGGYVGESVLGDASYLTAYEPIFDRGGEWLGAIAVGIQKDFFDAKLDHLRSNIIAGALTVEFIFVFLSIVALQQYQRQENLIHESEKKYRTLFEHSTEGIFLLSGTYIDCNEKAADLFGCSREEILGRTPAEFSPLYQQDGTLSAGFDRGRLRAILKSSDPSSFPWQHRRKDGTLIDTEISLNIVKIDQRRVVQAIVRDVTERLQTERLLSESEKQYRQLFSRMLNGFALFEVICDEAGEPVDYRFVDINEAFVKSSGKVRDDVLGRTLRETLPGFGAHWLRDFARVVTTGTPAHLENSSGSRGYWLEMSCYVPRPGQLAVVFSDITDRKMAERRLHEVVKILSELREENFFETLVAKVAALLGSDFLMVGELIPGDEDRVRSRAVFADGRLADNFEYLSPSPAGCWPQEGESLFALPLEEVAHLFPGERFSAEQWREGSCCVPLLGAEGNIVGFMAGFTRLGAEDKHTFEALFKLFSRRAGEELLRQGRERNLRTVSGQIRLITDSVPVAIAYADRTRRYGFINRQYGAIFGLDPAAVVGKRIDDVLGEQLSNSFQGRIARVLEGETVTLMTERIKADGQKASLLSTYVPHLDDAGKVIGIFIQHYDTTDQTLAQNALRESEQRYRVLFETTGTATLLVEEDSTIKLTNHEFERLSQRPRLELEGRQSYFELFDAESRERVRRYHRDRRVNPGSAPSSYECTLVRPDGSQRYLQAHVSLIPGTGRSIASYHDITPLKMLKVFLEGQLSFLEVLLNTIPSPIFYKDRQGIYLGCNKAFEAYLGRPREEIVGRSVYQMAPKELADVYFEMDEDLFNTPGVQSYETSVRHGDGTDHQVVFFKATFNSAEGGVGGLVGVILDVTELKRSQEELRESEERFHEIFTQNQDAIIIFGGEGNTSIIDANPVALELFGYRREELLALHPSVLLRPRDCAAVIRHLKENAEQRVFQFDQLTGLRRGGEPFVASVRGKEILLQKERVFYFSIRDVSEKLQLEERVRRTQAKLIHANKMTSLGMLTSSVAHEINNPNSYIAVNAATLTDVWTDALPILQRFHAENGDFQLGGLPFSDLEKLAPRLFRAIIEGSGRIAGIVSNMKNFVRDSSERQYRNICINQVVEQATTILWHHIHKHTDHFKTDLAKGLPPVQGNAQQLEQVLINLIMNALQALPDRDREITVETRLDEGGSTLVVFVRDAGRGMEAETMSHLTEPFFTTRMEEGGTGLGLYISSSIINEHGGQMTFSSCREQGTMVALRLPVAGTAGATNGGMAEVAPARC